MASELRRFLAFGGDEYYPNGGWDDFAGSFDTEDAAFAAVKDRDWCHVIDTQDPPPETP